ncbi:MAG TPA: methyltransferase, partial [Chitinophagaceae bacterium]
MRNTLKYIVGSTWQPFLVKYLSKTRSYQYGDIRLTIPATVFHPGFFFSTNLLLNQLKEYPLAHQKVLEPGAGSGLLSIYAAKQGAIVTATDINPASIECLTVNARENDVELNVITSDLFDRIPEQQFDVIVVNPPYYRKKAVSYADYAWNCGENGEYFEKFFSQAKRFVHPASKILMVLCDACDMQMVEGIAQ